MHPLPIVLCLIAVVMVPAVIADVPASDVTGDVDLESLQRPEDMNPLQFPTEIEEAVSRFSEKRGNYWKVAEV